jgi:SWI/SNF-related matrix-associated actin-dependent regulator of chromatin subfamily B member 1
MWIDADFRACDVQDCPNKIYTAAPGKVVDDFEVHLRNRMHREKVQTRLDGR